jgi:hypothetical protein
MEINPSRKILLRAVWKYLAMLGFIIRDYSWVESEISSFSPKRKN